MAVRVQIKGGHPHGGEFGILADEQLAERLGRNMTADSDGQLVQLENCPHGSDCCYVFPGDFRLMGSGARRR